MKNKPTLKDLQIKVDELTEALQRERADSINIRRRSDEEKARLSNFYKSMIIQGLLPAVDNLERALAFTPKDLEGHEYVKGVSGVVKQFERAFSDLGIERIATVGESFDPNLHEAVGMDDGDGDSEVIIEELQAGYKMGDEIIRHAMVKVGRK